MTGSDFVEVPDRRFGQWLTAPIWRYRATYAKVGLAAALINIFGLATALFTMTVYDRVVPNAAFASLLALSIGLALVLLFDFALKLLRAYFVDHAGARIDDEIGERAFARLSAMRLELRKGSTGDLTGMMRELSAVRDFFASVTLVALVDVPFILLTLVVIAFIGGWVAVVPAIMVPIVVLVGLAVQPALQRNAAQTAGLGLHKQSILIETIGSIEHVKASGASAMLRERWRSATRSHARSDLRQRILSSIATTVATTASLVSYAGVVIVGVFLIADNALSLGGLIACSILAGRAVAPLTQIAQLLGRLTATRVAYRQIRQLMDLPVEGPDTHAIAVGALQGSIELRQASFSYPGSEAPALHSTDLTIAPGEHVALIGRVGSGKSTLARLMLGLYPAHTGLVLIDGVNLAQLDPVAIRAQMGAVLQDPALFSGSIRENIALGREAVDDAEMLRVAKIAGTDQFIGSLSHGYDLRLADRGEGLSGGQRQSIAIARALAGRPAIMVMDEPTSAMDAQTEAALIERLRPELEGRTLVLVTHRQPLLALVERVIVTENGRIIADGPRDKIMAQLVQRAPST